MTHIQTALKKKGLAVFANCSAKTICRFAIGGPIALYVKAAALKQLEYAVTLCAENSVPCRVIGEGTNIFFADTGYSGVIVRMVNTELFFDGNTATVGAGVNLQSFIEHASTRDMGGLSPLFGIPGSVGGAVTGNAGAFGKAMNDFVISAEVFFPNRGIETMSNSDLGFEYRHSILKNNGYLISVRLNLQRRKKQDIQKNCADILNQRLSKHPGPEIKTGGSYFKNIKTLKTLKADVIPAGKLLDEIGAKEISVNDAAVFPGHANILINRGAATATDMLTLEKRLKSRVKDHFKITLEREVQYID